MSGPTIGLVANIFNEALALPGWLETHLPFFDDVRVLHAGPGGEYSTDGTMEVLEKWKVPYLVGSIDDGFGAVRTRAIRSSPCDWVVILDADERFYPIHWVMKCEGRDTPGSEVDEILRSYDCRVRDGVLSRPDWDTIARLGVGLKVARGATYDQGAWLRDVIGGNGHLDAVLAVRRHWHDLGMQRPTQNWTYIPDYQARIVRNTEGVWFDAGTKMHERLVGAVSTYRAEMGFGPYIDHFHFPFRRMDPLGRYHAVAIYDSIHAGRRPPTQEEFYQTITAGGVG